MDDGDRTLTAHEQQAFDEIEGRLRDDLEPARRHRRATVIWSMLIVTGMMFSATGLIANNIAVAFAGFVAVLIGVERFTQTSTIHRWCHLAAQGTGLLSSDETPNR